MSNEELLKYTPPRAYCYSTGIAGLSVPSCSSRTITVDVGATILPWNYLSCSCGDHPSAPPPHLFSAQILKDGVVVKEDSEYHNTNEYINQNHDGEYSFNMPNQQTKIELKGWAYDSFANEWVHCYTVTYTLNPAAQYCDQDVKVRGHLASGGYVNLNSVLVYAKHGSEPSKTCRTYSGSNNPGECTITDLEIDKSYTLSCDPSYVSGKYWASSSKNITACTGQREVLTCEEEIVNVPVTFTVKSDQGTHPPIAGATVSISGIGSCTTNVNGVCTLTVQKGKPYIAYMTHPDYEDESESFTCTQSACYITDYMTPKGIYCDIVTDKDSYNLGETVRIDYYHAPPNTTLLIRPSVGSGGDSWTVSDAGTKTYPLKLTDPVGSWVVELYDTNCSKSKTITVTEILYEDTKITDFAITEQYGDIPVTELHVGKIYKLNACLKTVNDDVVKGAYIAFKKPTGVEINPGHDDTGYDGFTSALWTPESSDVGSYAITAEFAGAIGFNPSSTSTGVTVSEAPIVKNYDIVCKVAFCDWGFDWLIDNFTTKVLPHIVSALNNLSISGLVVYSAQSYYDSNAKEMIFNADIPVQSPIPETIVKAIKNTILLALLALPGIGVIIKILGLIAIYFRRRDPGIPLPTSFSFVDGAGQEIKSEICLELNISDGTLCNEPGQGIYYISTDIDEDTIFNITKIISYEYKLADESILEEDLVAGEDYEITLVDKPLEKVDVRIEVIDEETTEPENEAFVRLVDEEDNTIKSGETNTDGKITFEQIEKRVYTVKVIGKTPPDSNYDRKGTGTLDANTETSITVELKKILYDVINGEIISHRSPEELLPGSALRVPTTIENTGSIPGEFRMVLYDKDTGTEIDHKPIDDWKELKGGAFSITFAIFGEQLKYDAIPRNQITEAVDYIKSKTNAEIKASIISFDVVPSPHYYEEGYEKPCHFLAPWNIPESIKQQLQGDIIVLLWNDAGYEVCLGGGTWGAGINDVPVCSLPFNEGGFNNPDKHYNYTGTAYILHEFCNACTCIAQKKGIPYPSVENCPQGACAIHETRETCEAAGCDWLATMIDEHVIMKCYESKKECYDWSLEHLSDIALGEAYTATLNGVMPDKDWGLKIELKEKDTPSTLDSEEFFVKKAIITPCEPTGFACDGRIKSEDIPEYAMNGSKVDVTVTVDNLCYGVLDPELTKYRVKFDVEGQTPEYSIPFILANNIGFGEPYLKDVPFSFTMPDYGVTLIAKVEHCNEQGAWEPCEDPDHEKEYNIELVHYTEPHGGIVSISPDCAVVDCFGKKGDEFTYDVTIKNDGAKKGEFKALLVDVDDDDRVIDDEPDLWFNGALEPGEEKTFRVTTVAHFGAMPEHDWLLRIDVVQKDPLYADDSREFTIIYEGYTIELDKIPVLINGQDYTFTGSVKLKGLPVPAGETIEIWEDDLFFNDKLCVGVTDTNGAFAINWKVDAPEGVLGGEHAEIFAKHLDSGSTSDVQKVVIRKPEDAILILDTIDSPLTQGDMYTFTGTLTWQGTPLVGQKIKIWEDDVFFNDLLCEGVTDANGTFAIEWEVDAPGGILDGAHAEIFAKAPDVNAASDVQKVRIVRAPGPVLKLNHIQSPLIIGEAYAFTGNLTTQEGLPMANAIIEIFEEDQWPNPDDLLCTGTTDSGGDFEIPWVVRKIEGVLIGDAEIAAYHRVSDTRTFWQKVRIKPPSELSLTIKREILRTPIKTMLPAAVELEYEDDYGEWQPVSGYPEEEVEDNPVKLTKWMYGHKHRARAYRDRILTPLLSDWEEILDPLTWDEDKLAVTMKTEFGAVEEEED